MDANKCPVGMVWLILGLAVYWVVGDRTDGLAGQSTEQNGLPIEDNLPMRIRPPPLLL